MLKEVRNKMANTLETAVISSCNLRTTSPQVLIFPDFNLSLAIPAFLNSLNSYCCNVLLCLDGVSEAFVSLFFL